MLAPSVLRRLMQVVAATPAARAPEPDRLAALTDRERAQLVVIAYETALVTPGG